MGLVNLLLIDGTTAKCKQYYSKLLFPSLFVNIEIKAFLYVLANWGKWFRWNILYELPLTQNFTLWGREHIKQPYISIMGFWQCMHKHISIILISFMQKHIIICLFFMWVWGTKKVNHHAMSWLPVLRQWQCGKSE